MARNAGRYADGICSVGVMPARFRDTLLPAFARGAREAGKRPELMRRMVWVPTSYHPDPETALAAARLEAGVLVPRAFDTVLDPRELEELGETVDEATIRASACVASSPEEIVQALSRYVQAGASRAPAAP